MKPNQAKKLMAEFLRKNNLPFEKLTARQVDFADLARSVTIFVEVHGWQPSPRWQEVKDFAIANGFLVE